MEDVWDYTLKLKYEAENMSRGGVVKGVFYQLPFFTCPSLFYSDKHQKDITKYLYCDDTKTPPYPGGYGQTTNIWKEKHFLIKQALSILYQDKKDELKAKQKHGNGYK